MQSSPNRVAGEGGLTMEPLGTGSRCLHIRRTHIECQSRPPPSPHPIRSCWSVKAAWTLLILDSPVYILKISLAVLPTIPVPLPVSISFPSFLPRALSLATPPSSTNSSLSSVERLSFTPAGLIFGVAPLSVSGDEKANSRLAASSAGMSREGGISGGEGCLG